MTRREIAQSVAAAYRDRCSIAPCVPPEKLTLTIEAQTDVAATLISTIPGMEPAAVRTASFQGPWPELWRTFIVANSLANLATTAGGSWYFGPIAGALAPRYAAPLDGDARAIAGAFMAEQFSPPWGPACPSELVPWNEQPIR